MQDTKSAVAVPKTERDARYEFNAPKVRIEVRRARDGCCTRTAASMGM